MSIRQGDLYNQDQILKLAEKEIILAVEESGSENFHYVFQKGGQSVYANFHMGKDGRVSIDFRFGEKDCSDVQLIATAHETIASRVAVEKKWRYVMCESRSDLSVFGYTKVVDKWILVHPKLTDLSDLVTEISKSLNHLSSEYPLLMVNLDIVKSAPLEVVVIAKMFGEHKVVRIHQRSEGWVLTDDLNAVIGTLEKVVEKISNFVDTKYKAARLSDMLSPGYWYMSRFFDIFDPDGQIPETRIKEELLRFATYEEIELAFKKRENGDVHSHMHFANLTYLLPMFDHFLVIDAADDGLVTVFTNTQEKQAAKCFQDITLKNALHEDTYTYLKSLLN
jgi:hypothetical protein